MFKSSQKGQKPSHELLAVKQTKDGKAYWTRIGAAWPHKDGKGFSLKFNFYPAEGQNIQLRLPMEKDENGGAQ